jgi:hypothetical protein
MNYIENSQVKAEEKNDRIYLSFDYDESIKDNIKEIDGRHYNPDEKNWDVPLSAKEEVVELQKKYSDTRKSKEVIREFLETTQGTECEMPELPTSWNHYKKEYAAILRFNEDNEIVRHFLGNKKNYTGSRKNADIVYQYSELCFYEGDILEIKNGSHKNMYYSYYRNADGGWRHLGNRETSSAFFGHLLAKKESLKEMVKKEVIDEPINKKALIMRRAWELARQGQSSFGGKIREYLSEAMKAAWSEFKKQ